MDVEMVGFLVSVGKMVLTTFFFLTVLLHCRNNSLLCWCCLGTSGWSERHGFWTKRISYFLH